MIKRVLLGLGFFIVVLVIGVVAVASTKPDSFRIERRTTIAAPPSAVFENVNDFKRWEAWSPWAKKDPEMKTTYSGPAQGVGASYAWKGNSSVGEGRMTIEQSKPHERVAIRLEFLAPFPATNTAIFTLEPRAPGSEVTWAMEGRNTFQGKVVSVFADMDSMVGPDFERGLAGLKRISESGGPH